MPLLPARLLATAALAALVAASAGCAADPQAEPVRSETDRAPVSAPAVEPSPPPAPGVTAVPRRGVLSGELGVVDGPLLAVKIDNTAPAQPQIGVQAADVVYVEEVESGLTRLLALYSSELPSAVGPVRSARVSDIEMLAAHGPVALAYSGAHPGMMSLLAGSALRLISMDANGQGYRRERGRRAPYNVVGDPRALLERAPGAAVSQDVGLEFGPPPAGGRPAAGASTGWRSASIDFAWSPEQGRWLVVMDRVPSLAAEGGQLGATTVVFQQVAVEASPFSDINGSPTPTVRTVGSGAVTMLRDGLVFDGAWSRPDAASGTAYTGADGAPLTFSPGQLWVVLIPTGTAVSVR